MIQLFIWDFDGTLYRIPEQLAIAERNSKIAVIEKLKKLPHNHAVAEFHRVMQTEKSATAAVAQICGITVYEAAKLSEALFDRRQYIQRDEKLVNLFNILDSRNLLIQRRVHYILANGWRAKIEEALPALGLPVNLFQEIVTSETVGVNKPHPDGYLYILKKTGLPPDKHLMIGDREAVDLVTAKRLGMQTCLVGGTIEDKAIVDFSVPTVYQIADFLK